MRPTRVLIADDYVVFRQMMRALVEAEEDFKVAGEAANLEEVARLVRYYPPDIVVMGLPMIISPRGSPVLALALAFNLGPKLVLIGEQDLPEYAELAKKLGASAYLAQEGLASQLVPLLRNLQRPPRKPAGAGLREEG